MLDLARLFEGVDGFRGTASSELVHTDVRQYFRQHAACATITRVGGREASAQRECLIVGSQRFIGTAKLLEHVPDAVMDVGQVAIGPGIVRAGFAQTLLEHLRFAIGLECFGLAPERPL